MNPFLRLQPERDQVLAKLADPDPAFSQAERDAIADAINMRNAVAAEAERLAELDREVERIHRRNVVLDRTLTALFALFSASFLGGWVISRDWSALILAALWACIAAASPAVRWLTKRRERAKRG